MGKKKKNTGKVRPLGGYRVPRGVRIPQELRDDPWQANPFMRCPSCHKLDSSGGTVCEVCGTRLVRDLIIEAERDKLMHSLEHLLSRFFADPEVEALWERKLKEWRVTELVALGIL